MAMSVNLLFQVFSWAAVALTLLAALASGGVIVTGKMIETKKDAQIAALSPRELTAVQRTTLLEQIRPVPGKVAFISRLMDGEGHEYAAQLAQLFSSAGWTVVSIAGNSLAELPGKVTVAVSDPSMVARGTYVCNALSKAGIRCGADLRSGSMSGPLSADTLYVVVGRKP